MSKSPYKQPGYQPPHVANFDLNKDTTNWHDDVNDEEDEDEEEVIGKEVA